jgi:DNA-binding PadR family transcriptional regulator
MTAGRLPEEGAGHHDSAPMRSPVNWALLGLVIERPTYAYDLAQRFERRYGTVLMLSNIGHVYTALGALESRALVEEVPGTREGRQPRPRYRATDMGVSEYGRWLVTQAGEDRRRSQLFVLALAALAARPEQLLEVISGYEQAWLAEGARTPIERAKEGEDDSPDVLAALLRRLIDEESRLAVGSKLAWIEYARQELEKLGERLRRSPSEHRAGEEARG